MNERRRIAWIGMALATMLLFCLGAGVALSSSARPLRTHADTVAYILERRGIDYRNIVFNQSYEESVEFDFFRAQVQVHLPDGSVANGWIGCENRDRSCFLELRSVGIVGVLLPDIGLTQEPAWRIWFDYLRAKLGY